MGKDFLEKLKDRKILNDTAILALEIIGGILLLLWPAGSVSLLFRALGVVCLVGGGIRLYGYFNKKNVEMDNRLQAAVSGLVCLLGLSFVINPRWLLNSASFLVGLMVLLYGLYLLYTARDAQPADGKKGVGMISPAVIAVLGILLIIFPKLVVNFGLRIVGVALLLTAANQIYTDYTAGKNKGTKA